MKDDPIKDLINIRNMKKYLVRFITKSGDNDKEWCYAENKHQAAQQIRDEHWNIKSIDLVTEL